jgi:glycosyltransferase involved in cell wall biosynthesis
MSMHVVTSGWLLGAPSGANTRLLALLRAMGALLLPDERITVLHRPDYAPPRIHDRIGWHSIAVPPGPTWRRVAAERRLLAHTLQHLGANVLDHGFLPTPEVPCPVVLTIHDLRDVDGQGRRPSTLARWLVRRSALRAHTVLVPSAFTAGRLRAVAPQANVLVAANGVELPPAAATPSDAGYVLHVGHLEARKNLAVLLHALAAMPQATRPELRLVGADAGEGRRLRDLAHQLGIAASVHLLGVLGDEALQQQYAAARAVVVPSRYEGFGLPALEGLAHGKPTLVSDQGALPEIVGSQGTILPAEDIAAWTTALQSLQHSVGDADARRAHAGTFAWTASAAVVLSAFRQAARSGLNRA